MRYKLFIPGPCEVDDDVLEAMAQPTLPHYGAEWMDVYRETLRLMREVGVRADDALLRLPFELRYPDGFVLRARRLPAPLHLVAALLGAKRLCWRQRRHVVAFVLRWQARGWRAAGDAPASTLFADAPAEIVLRLWRPLCLAALNVELGQASAQILLNVLRDSLAGNALAADLLIPRRDLTRVFAEPALQTLIRRGADVRLRSPVQQLSRVDSQWRIEVRDTTTLADSVVLALPPDRAASLLSSARQAELLMAADLLRAIRMAPIATVYLRYPPSVRLPWPASALLDDPTAGRYGHWVFDRGRLDEANAGVLSVVISAAGSALADDSASLAASVDRQLTTDIGLPKPLAAAVIAEKRATIVPSAELKRPPTRLAAASLYLAGDAAQSDYPSTLEGSVRSGFAAARAIASDYGDGRTAL
jgi:squalene-associated FAD-dependent desaturase